MLRIRSSRDKRFFSNDGRAFSLGEIGSTDWQS